MGVYERRDSPFFWIWPEGTAKPFSSKIPIGEGAQKKLNRQQAEAIYAATMGDIARGTFHLPSAKPTITFRQWAIWYRDHVTKHHRGWRRASSMITALIKDFADIPLRDIDSARIEEWKTRRASQVKPATVNRELELLKPLLRKAVGKYLDKNPADGVKRFKTRRPPISIVAESAEDALLEHATAEERAMILLGTDALLRLGDVRRLRLEHDHGSYLEIVDPKTEAYKVPVSVRLRSALDKLKLRAEQHGGYYFPRKRKGKWSAMSENTAFLLWSGLCDRANVPRGRKLGGITFHSTRHTGATRATRAAGLPVVKELGGWKSYKQLERYVHPDNAEMIRAVEAIGSRSTHAGSGTAKKSRKKAG